MGMLYVGDPVFVSFVSPSSRIPCTQDVRVELGLRLRVRGSLGFRVGHGTTGPLVWALNPGVLIYALYAVCNLCKPYSGPTVRNAGPHGKNFRI